MKIKSFFLKFIIFISFFFACLLGLESFLESDFAFNHIESPKFLFFVEAAFTLFIILIIYLSTKLIYLNRLFFKTLIFSSKVILSWFGLCFIIYLLICFDFSKYLISQTIFFFLWPVEFIYMILPNYIFMRVDSSHLFLFMIFILAFTFRMSWRLSKKNSR